MNWNQLQYIITIAEEKNITKAAEKLYISQPSLSLSLRSLEDELGTPLFERRHGTLCLTYAGSLFYDWAVSTLHSRQQLSTKLNDISANSRQLIQIGISPHRSSIMLPRIFERFYNNFPDCEIRLVEQPTFILRKMLENNEIDFMIDVPNPDTINYTSEILTEEKIILAVPSDFLKNGITPKRDRLIALESTSAFPYIMLSSNQVIGKLSKKICDTFLFHPEVRLTCVSIETALTFVSRQLGIAFVPEIFAKQNRFSSEIRYFYIDGVDEARQICLIYPKKQYQSRQLKFLLDLFREIIPEIYNV